MNATRTIASKIYVSIARKNSALAAENLSVLKKLEVTIGRDSNDQKAIKEWGSTHNDLVEQGAIAIVFAAAAAEAYIYDYGARNLSANFVKKYLDKLNLVQRWVVIPRLATGRQFPTQGQGIQLLRRLVANRNKLIHFKSGEGKSDLDPEQLVRAASEALDAIDSLISDMAKADTDELAHLQLP